MNDAAAHFQRGDAYARFRPGSPPALFDWIAARAPARAAAWDVGTGSGQAAAGLAERFEQVFATDVSEDLAVHVGEVVAQFEHRLAGSKSRPLVEAHEVAEGLVGHAQRAVAGFEQEGRRALADQVVRHLDGLHLVMAQQERLGRVEGGAERTGERLDRRLVVFREWIAQRNHHQAVSPQPDERGGHLGRLGKERARKGLGGLARHERRVEVGRGERSGMATHVASGEPAAVHQASARHRRAVRAHAAAEHGHAEPGRARLERRHEPLRAHVRPVRRGDGRQEGEAGSGGEWRVGHRRAEGAPVRKERPFGIGTAAPSQSPFASLPAACPKPIHVGCQRAGMRVLESGDARAKERAQGRVAAEE